MLGTYLYQLVRWMCGIVARLFVCVCVGLVVRHGLGWLVNEPIKLCTCTELKDLPVGTEYCWVAVFRFRCSVL